MKLNKIFLPLVAAATLFGSCTDEVEYTPAESVPVTDFYFPTEQTYHTDLVDGDNAVTVNIARANSNGAATVNIESVVNNGGEFTIPTSVSFADGIGVASFQIGFDLAKLEVNKEYSITLSIPGVESTPYSLGSVEITMLYLPWRDFEEDNSMGEYTEGGFATLFGDPVTTYPVKVQKHPLNDNIFRIVNPYGPGVWPALDEFGTHDGEDHYMVIDCTNPKRVFVPEFFTGVTMQGFGPVSMASYAYLLEVISGNSPDAIEKNGFYGTYDAAKGIIKAGEDSFWAAWINNGGDEGWYRPKTNDFQLVLPGFEPEPEWEEYGICNFTDGLLGPWFGMLNNTYPVLVEHSLLDDNLYRIVNPYSANCGYFEEGGEIPGYFQFSIADPDFVTIGKFSIGLYMDAANTTALYEVSSLADFAIEYMGMSVAEAKASGYGAVYKDKVLTLPADVCAATILDVAAGKLRISAPKNGCDMVLDMSNPIPSTPAAEAPRAMKANKKISAEKVGAGKFINADYSRNLKLN